MAQWQFVGEYETLAGLPDGSVVLVSPGEVVDLSYADPGPLWSPVAKKSPGKGTPEPAPDDAPVT